MTKFNLKQKVVAFFEENRAKQAKNREIAEWIVKKYPKACQQKIDASSRAPYSQEHRERWIVSRLINDLSSGGNKNPNMFLEEGFKRVKIDGVWGLRLTNNTPKNSHRVIKEPITSTKQKTSEKIAEEDMYDPLIQFLREEHGIHSKRIEHRSSRQVKKGEAKWLYPDLVGLQDLSGDWDEKVRDCVRLYSDKMSKLWSFELKKEITISNIREYFFQAVSNSSWANFGYLVACEINNESLKQLRILSSLHGIGFIKLNIKKSKESQIMIPAQEKKEIDWNIVNKIAEANRDYREYIQLIKGIHKLGKAERKIKWDSD